MKNKYTYKILIELLQNLCNAIGREEYERAYDLVDVFHCLPEIIADNHFSIPKSYWNVMTKKYRLKWDRKFLMEEQKKYRRYL